MNQLIIDDHVVRVNADGMYSLNDLHVAAGGEDRHKPGNWTRELIAQIDRCSDLSNGIISVSTTQGTYVCKELVYTYAMWVSAAFQLKVIRAYDNQAAPDCHRTHLKIMTSELQGLNAIDFSDGVIQASALDMDD